MKQQSGLLENELLLIQGLVADRIRLVKDFREESQNECLSLGVPLSSASATAGSKVLPVFCT